MECGKTMKKYSIFCIVFVLLTTMCAREQTTNQPIFELPSKPYTRYWWFASMIQEEDIKFNLDWLKANGFGGIELAWVYPLNRFNPEDTSYTPRQEWLSAEWTQIVDYAVRYADSIGFGCDLTLGTLWPFGDTKVTFEQATQRYGDPEWRQEIGRSWEYPKDGYVIDHLTPAHYQPYFDRLLQAFPRPQTNIRQSYFIDSWEVETEKLWCDGFDRDFEQRFGYDIKPYMNTLYEPENNRYFYDYMCLMSDKVLQFYHDFDSTLNSVGILSRGQVSGAPCDLISGYAKMDIPEGESMLYEPEFCAIPASAALVAGKKYVTSESFTCLYGWPRDYIREEQTADLKLVADALFANGINHIVWHGKAHNPKGSDSVNFYATTHIGADSKMSADIRPFNAYLEKVSSYMKKGVTYSDIAVYLPTEDAWMAGIMPKEKQFLWAWGYYEMRYVYFPDELAGYNPTWINGEFLQKAIVKDGVMKVGDATYQALYIDAKYLDYNVLKRMTELAGNGVTVILKQEPKEPGAMPHPDYAQWVGKLKNAKTTASEIPQNITPLIAGKNIPTHWCRKDDETLYLFFPHPKAYRIQFPMEYGQSLETATVIRDICIDYQGKKHDVTLTFAPYQSLLYAIRNGKIEKIPIDFIPDAPEVRKRPEGYKAPWLVE